MLALLAAPILLLDVSGGVQGYGLPPVLSTPMIVSCTPVVPSSCASLLFYFLSPFQLVSSRRFPFPKVSREAGKYVGYLSLLPSIRHIAVLNPVYMHVTLQLTHYHRSSTTSAHFRIHHRHQTFAACSFNNAGPKNITSRIALSPQHTPSPLESLN